MTPTYKTFHNSTFPLKTPPAVARERGCNAKRDKKEKMNNEY
jgi:hypothetical protein